MSLVEIVCDGGPEQGFGHFRRSLALAHVLQEREHDVRVRSLSRSGNSLLEKESAPDSSGIADLLVFDLPDNCYEVVERACGGPTPTLALDYFGTACPSLTISVRERSSRTVGKRRSGIKYAIIRNEILDQSPQEQGIGVLVMLGGSDVRGLSESLARQLEELGENVTLILGPFAPEIELSGSTTILRNPAHLPSLMANTKWAVTSGGVSMTELLYLGKAVHVAAQTDAETALASLVFQRGALLGIGAKELQIYPDERIDEVALCARELVDGLGAQRIAEEIEELL